MIDINLWQELSLFEKYGTLSKVSEELFISQPALSRSMNKLEKEATVDYYSVILKKNHKKFSKLFNFIKNKENSRSI